MGYTMAQAIGLGLPIAGASDYAQPLPPSPRPVTQPAPVTATSPVQAAGAGSSAFSMPIVRAQATMTPNAPPAGSLLLKPIPLPSSITSLTQQAPAPPITPVRTPIQIAAAATGTQPVYGAAAMTGITPVYSSKLSDADRVKSTIISATYWPDGQPKYQVTEKKLDDGSYVLTLKTEGTGVKNDFKQVVADAKTQIGMFKMKNANIEYLPDGSVKVNNAPGSYNPTADATTSIGLKTTIKPASSELLSAVGGSSKNRWIVDGEQETKAPTRTSSSEKMTDYYVELGDNISSKQVRYAVAPTLTSSYLGSVLNPTISTEPITTPDMFVAGKLISVAPGKSLATERDKGVDWKVAQVNETELKKAVETNADAAEKDSIKQYSEYGVLVAPTERKYDESTGLMMWKNEKGDWSDSPSAQITKITDKEKLLNSPLAWNAYNGTKDSMGMSDYQKQGYKDMKMTPVIGEGGLTFEFTGIKPTTPNDRYVFSPITKRWIDINDGKNNRIIYDRETKQYSVATPQGTFKMATEESEYLKGLVKGAYGIQSDVYEKITGQKINKADIEQASTEISKFFQPSVSVGILNDEVLQRMEASKTKLPLGDENIFAKLAGASDITILGTKAGGPIEINVGGKTKRADIGDVYAGERKYIEEGKALEGPFGLAKIGFDPEGTARKLEGRGLLGNAGAFTTRTGVAAVEAGYQFATGNLEQSGRWREQIAQGAKAAGMEYGAEGGNMRGLSIIASNPIQGTLQAKLFPQTVFGFESTPGGHYTGSLRKQLEGAKASATEATWQAGTTGAVYAGLGVLGTNVATDTKLAQTAVANKIPVAPSLWTKLAPLPMSYSLTSAAGQVWQGAPLEKVFGSFLGPQVVSGFASTAQAAGPGIQKIPGQVKTVVARAKDIIAPEFKRGSIEYNKFSEPVKVTFSGLGGTSGGKQTTILTDESGKPIAADVIARWEKSGSIPKTAISTGGAAGESTGKASGTTTAEWEGLWQAVSKMDRQYGPKLPVSYTSSATLNILPEPNLVPKPLGLFYPEGRETARSFTNENIFSDTGRDAGRSFNVHTTTAKGEQIPVKNPDGSIKNVEIIASATGTQLSQTRISFPGKNIYIKSAPGDTLVGLSGNDVNTATGGLLPELRTYTGDATRTRMQSGPNLMAWKKDSDGNIITTNTPQGKGYLVEFYGKETNAKTGQIELVPRGEQVLTFDQVKNLLPGGGTGTTVLESKSLGAPSYSIPTPGPKMDNIRLPNIGTQRSDQVFARDAGVGSKFSLAQYPVPTPEGSATGSTGQIYRGEGAPDITTLPTRSGRGMTLTAFGDEKTSISANIPFEGKTPPHAPAGKTIGMESWARDLATVGSANRYVPANAPDLGIEWIAGGIGIKPNPLVSLDAGMITPRTKMVADSGSAVGMTYKIVLDPTGGKPTSLNVPWIGSGKNTINIPTGEVPIVSGPLVPEPSGLQYGVGYYSQNRGKVLSPITSISTTLPTSTGSPPASTGTSLDISLPASRNALDIKVNLNDLFSAQPTASSSTSASSAPAVKTGAIAASNIAPLSDADSGYVQVGYGREAALQRMAPGETKTATRSTTAQGIPAEQAAAAIYAPAPQSTGRAEGRSASIQSFWEPTAISASMTAPAVQIFAPGAVTVTKSNEAAKYAPSPLSSVGVYAPAALKAYAPSAVSIYSPSPQARLYVPQAEATRIKQPDEQITKITTVPPQVAVLINPPLPPIPPNVMPPLKPPEQPVGKPVIPPFGGSMGSVPLALGGGIAASTHGPTGKLKRRGIYASLLNVMRSQISGYKGTSAPVMAYAGMSETNAPTLEQLQGKVGTGFGAGLTRAPAVRLAPIGKSVVGLPRINMGRLLGRRR